MRDPDENARAFAKALGVDFNDPALLSQALTHSSFVNEQSQGDSLRDNERLEFLGDAVLDLIAGELLFRKFPDAPEGELTQLRAALVRTESLSRLAKRFGLGDHLRIGHGEEISGGRQRMTTLCQAFEAVIGAMYLDRGLPIVEAFATPCLLDLLDDVIARKLHIDARSQLQERAQARLSLTPRYRVISAQGPDHEREFRVEALIGDSVIGSGIGSSKRAAAQDAARAALQQLDAGGFPDLNDLARDEN